MPAVSRRSPRLGLRVNLITSAGFDAKELTSNNRWHMMQSVANGVISVARYLGMAVFELREIKLELREVKKALREK
jgi:hypothetical protein